MFKKKLKYYKFLFIFFLAYAGFCFLFFQRGVVLAESGPDLMIDKITIVDKRPSTLYVWLKNIGDVYVATDGVGLDSIAYDRPVCEVGGVSCNKKGYSTTYYDRDKLLANGENSISTVISTGISGCPPYRKGSFEVSVCIYWKGITDVDISNNCKTVTLNYANITPECETDEHCGTGQYCSETCTCARHRKCARLDTFYNKNNIYTKNRFYSGYMGTSHAAPSFGTRDMYDSCYDLGLRKAVPEGGVLAELFCYIGDKNAADHEIGDVDKVVDCCVTNPSDTNNIEKCEVSKYCGLSKNYVECPSGYECRNGACKKLVVATPTQSPDELCPFFPQGDANCDDKVNSLDFGFWRRSYQTDERADFNDDETSDLLDCFICFDHYSRSF